MDAFITRKRPRSVERPESTGIMREPSISPPPRRKNLKPDVSIAPETVDLTSDDEEARPDGQRTTDRRLSVFESRESAADESSSEILPSPMQLNHVQGLSASGNIDTMKLSDLLGDPMIKECWLFNYLFDIDFIMQQFDPDTRDMIRIRVVHGSWKAEDSNGIGIIEGARRYPNIQIVKAYMAETFGTHHSKMIVLFRHDDLAQIIILTANFIERDWSMSQAIWKTPLLPLLQRETSPLPSLPSVGSGPRFKHDLLAYFRAYGSNKLQPLATQLHHYDFSTVRGALIASVPSRQILQSLDPDNETLWGWPALKNILSQIPSAPPNPSSKSHIVIQVSSIASVGEKWLRSTFFPALSTSSSLPSNTNNSTNTTPKISLIFPTAATIRRSITGYAAGASIHMRLSSPAQKSQLAFLRPLLHHWASYHKRSKSAFFSNNADVHVREAGRQRAAPHIKTYTRFRDEAMERIEWAMVTSANLSTQAWGAGAGAGGEVRVCSFEVGVVVWPGLWEEERRDVRMVPCFGGNWPSLKGNRSVLARSGQGGEVGCRNERGNDVKEEVKLVGWRMPYDLPLVPYTQDEKPWCASEPDGERDCLGRVWAGYGSSV